MSSRRRSTAGFCRECCASVHTKLKYGCPRSFHLATMLRALFLVSLAATLGAATPVAAVGAQVTDCSGLTLAFTESDDTHVDLYVTELIEPDDLPQNVDVEWVKAQIAQALLEIERMLEPGEVGRGDIVAQFELQIGQRDEPAVSGIRFTYMVNVNSCTGV